MTTTCKKVFQSFEDAKAFTFAHRDEYPRLRRTDAETAKLLNSDKPWMVIWYERSTYAPTSKDCTTRTGKDAYTSYTTLRESAKRVNK